MTLWLYAIALTRSWEVVSRNWVVSFAPLAYSLAFALLVALVAPFGLIGGLLLGLGSQACVSSGLYLIENLITRKRVDFDDFTRGFMVYLWELLRIAFILWIPLQVAAIGLATVPNGTLIFFIIKIALYILLNPVPEFIYQTRTSGLELLGASYNFIVENWIEWFVPNILLTVIGYYLLGVLGTAVVGLPGFVQLLIYFFGFGLCLTYFMVFRGFLFAQLNGSTRRSRLYRFKAGNLQ